MMTFFMNMNLGTPDLSSSTRKTVYNKKNNVRGYNDYQVHDLS